MVKVNIQEEIERINHTRRLYDMLFQDKKIEQDVHSKLVTFCYKEITAVNLVFVKYGKEINV